jgi:hypothetical protein
LANSVGRAPEAMKPLSLLEILPALSSHAHGMRNEMYI